ncbi:MAG: oxidoreductase [Verrucomicrobia bacterium]|nr:MAG: oxidoreductase [Verrucomicrobiota bacterium]
MSSGNRTLSRRRFLRTSAAIAAGSGLPAWFVEVSRGYAATTKPASPNDKPSIALIGCGGQGRYDATLAAKFANIVAVCDVDAKRAEAASKQFNGAKVYNDFRKLLERADLHAVINGTPDHWHTFINIAAMKAGKDVYSEKPLTLTIDEGKRLIAVMRETKRVLQTGSQQRSDARFRLACELVRNHRMGKLKHVTTLLPAGPRKGPFNPAPVPPELDWDFWQGQTPFVPYVRERCHGSFRYWWEYSGGTMTDWGAHHNDIALWGLGLERSGPVTIEGKPLVEMIPGGFTASAEYRVEYTYANGVTHTCRSTTADNPGGGAIGQGEHHGVKFEGIDGWIFVTRGKIETSNPELLTEPLSAGAIRFYVSDDHMGNFFDCIRSRKQPVCDVEIGHRSVSVCHLGVISIRIGRKLHWDPDGEQFVGDAEANKWLARPQRKPWTYDLA